MWLTPPSWGWGHVSPPSAPGRPGGVCSWAHSSCPWQALDTYLVQVPFTVTQEHNGVAILHGYRHSC